MDNVNVIGRKTDGQKDRRTESQMGEREKGNITTKIERHKNTKADIIYEFVIAAIVMMTKENIEPFLCPKPNLNNKIEQFKSKQFTSYNQNILTVIIKTF